LSFGNSRAISSNQPGIHEELIAKLQRHFSSAFRKPIAEHSLLAFQQADAAINQHGKSVIFDSCCGVGASSVRLAQMHPQQLVIGVDKSAHRLQKQAGVAAPDNLLLLRADLNDFWRLAFWAQWPVARQAIFYPNPWPKAEHLGRRWHGAPVFPYIAALGGQLEMRSNWKLYLQEFAEALRLLKLDSRLTLLPEGENMTPFEAKYQASGQQCWRLEADLSGCEGQLNREVLFPAAFSEYFQKVV